MPADTPIVTDAPTIFPSVHYADARTGTAFLERAFGFEPHVIYDAEGSDHVHIELRHGLSILFVGSIPERIGGGSLYVTVDDCDAHCARARAAGAEIVTEPYDTDYGSRDYVARDPDGNGWRFGTYQPRVDRA